MRVMYLEEVTCHVPPLKIHNTLKFFEEGDKGLGI